MSRKNKPTPETNETESAREIVEQSAPVEMPTTFTEEQQNAYAVASLSTGERNVKGYADIQDWYLRTNGGTVDA